MWYPPLKSLSIAFWNVKALAWVVIMVTLAPYLAKSLAVSTMGFRWPDDRYGRKATLSRWACDSVFMVNCGQKKTTHTSLSKHKPQYVPFFQFSTSISQVGSKIVYYSPVWDAYVPA